MSFIRGRSPGARSVIGQIPPSVGGINSQDAITSMPAQDALTLINFFPESTFIRSRRGSATWATGFSNPVESLMEWAGATRKLFAASGTAIYDATTAGAIGAAVLSGLTNARWQHTMFSNAGGNYLVMVNGADGVRTYDGSAWATQTISGVTAANLTSVTTYQRRLWFTEKNSSKAWYLGSAAISGAAASIDLGGVWRMGGTLVGIIAPSYDTQGQGIQNYIGFLSSNGEIATYLGTDPASASTFSLAGVFRLAAPASSRAWVQSGGDYLIATADGVISALHVFGLDESRARLASPSQKIADVIGNDYNSYGSLFGWQLLFYPSEHILLVNVPTSATTFKQYIMNTLTGAWCLFTDWNASCFANFNNALYYGAADRVVQAYTGFSDEGNTISCAMQTSFNTFRRSSTQKRATMIRPIIQANANPNLNVGVDVDYLQTTISAPFPVAFSGGVWGTSLWGAAVWTTGNAPLLQWGSVGSIGRALSVKVSAKISGIDLQINGFDVMFEADRGPTL